MSVIQAGFKRVDHDHFLPDADDPAAQRRLRGQLEQIDYTAFACNREVVAATIGKTAPAAFQNMALATARARAAWVAQGMKVAAAGAAPDAAAVGKLAELRTAYDELREVYEAARRMVERGYIAYEAAPQG